MKETCSEAEGMCFYRSVWSLMQRVFQILRARTPN